MIDIGRLAHAIWECKYHIGWCPKCRLTPESCTNYLLRFEAPRYDTWCKIQVTILQGEVGKSEISSG
jgi:REP element-mobilizing transposase RayT